MNRHVVVIGGGYSGLAAALRTARQLRDARVTLINPRAHFVERVRLHQIAAGQHVGTYPMADVLGESGIDFVLGQVRELDPESRQLVVDSLAAPVRYDTLVYALGSTADTSTPGVVEHAATVAELAGAQALRDRVTAVARDRGTLAVVGGGLTGIETATELAEAHPELSVRLVTDTEPGATLSERGRDHLRRSFDRLGVEVRSGAKAVAVRDGAVELADGGTVQTDLVVWATGFGVPDLAARSSIAVDAGGRVVVDDTLRSVSHPDVYAVGDSAAVHHTDGSPLRMSCATGLPLGQYVGDVIAARASGQQPRPRRFRYVIRCVSLGRNDGLIQFVDAHDRPHERILTGRVAARFKELVVRGAAFTARRPGPYLPWKQSLPPAPRPGRRQPAR